MQPTIFQDIIEGFKKEYEYQKSIGSVDMYDLNQVAEKLSMFLPNYEAEIEQLKKFYYENGKYDGLVQTSQAES